MEERELMIGLDLSLASPEVIEVLIEDVSDPGIFGEIARENVNRPEILRLLLKSPSLPEDVTKMITETLRLPAVPPKEIVKAEVPQDREIHAQSLLQKIQKLTVAQRIQLAMRGGREIRNILAKDPNKEVSLSVLENAKITETEVEMIAKNRFSLEEALRRISKNREWMKKYAIVLALVTNPKTPPGISVALVTEIKTKDLAIIEVNKNVAEAVRAAAKKLLRFRKKH
jgi:hypothetical protein